ncbi:ADP-ribosyl-(dinitrogen reductase) hydrolase [Marinobacter sp. SS8-8]|uniref:ADP-ribosyl-(dinitrogen reductase) hydrolase n=1 Tax=Marinobacter sp. SS8-8 TaxID=3050452 RepID=UPI000C369509|nr:ADP-ribosyl-(dinitrogen reductase) hydrolase [Marinobacter sp. SS8-8]MAZ05477.1 ADP-ribosyl-(dinitrogen reductase) hydrolase [Halomonas sp.]|tara:strand:+ start:399 stop:680 length:282 start_codon:yes stop_codon:yes gene_type:complete
MALKCSSAVKQKLAQKHGVSLEEVQQCFANREGNLLEDIREEHKTDPPTQWFIAETDYGRRLKVAFMLKGDDIIIKTSYEPNQTEDGIYRKFG